MKILSQIATVCALSIATTATAYPYCDALFDRDQLPQKFAKRGPFHVDADTGWIVGQDQLRSTFDVTDEVSALWREVGEAFRAKGVVLAVLSAPPRPFFAPAEVLPASYDATKARKAFSSYIHDLNAAGILAPDLTVLADTPTSQEYYFKRDTHWTPTGALASAELLATSLGAEKSSRVEAQFDQTYVEKGSLSAVVEKTCGARPEAETVPAPNYARTGDAAALMGATEAASIALVGTSFSDRYKTDSYQVAGALAHVFDAEVKNFSATGGGMVGAMEAFIQSGALEYGQFKTIIWETPYTSPLTQVSGLRQLLGALQKTGQAVAIYTGKIGTDWQTIKHPIESQSTKALQITTPGVMTGKMFVELYDSKGTKVRVKLIKSDRIDPAARSEIWRFSLAALPIADIARVKFKVEHAVDAAQIALIN